MNETKKNKIWMIISIIAFAIIIILGVILVVNNNSGKESSDGVKKIESKAKKEDVKIVDNKVSNLELEEYKNDAFL